MSGPTDKKGPIRFMARHPVASNLIMAALIAGGVFVGSRIKMEVFPEFEMDRVIVTVAYRGASPEEVEGQIVLVVEEAVSGLDGVEEVTSKSVEGAGTVTIELVTGADPNKALADIKNAVDRIATFPRQAEKPIVSLLTTRKQVISLVIFGDHSEHTLRGIAEKARADLLQRDDITQVELSGARTPEISVEVAAQQLRALDLTLDGVAREVADTSVEVSAGGVKTPSGEVLLRVAERRDRGDQFEDIPVLTDALGTRVSLGDVGDVRDGFQDTEESARFNGKPAVLVDVYRTGDETPIGVADAVGEYVSELRAELPPGVDVAVWRDDSRILRDRIDLLVRNAWMGLALVLLVLGLFLEMRLAFWVTMGIPISFLGSALLMPFFGVSINMITLFAFIVTLGMVVDDAIVVGENTYHRRQQGMGAMAAAIAGAREVAVPITFSILTSIAAFSPLFFVPGFMGKIFFSIPAIVVSVLLISLFESLFVLPAHLGHLKDGARRGIRGAIHRAQQTFARSVEWLIEHTYRPTLRVALRLRYITTAMAVGVLVLTAGYVAGGFIKFEFMPDIDSDIVGVAVRMPYGTPVAETETVRDELLSALRLTIEANGGEGVVEGIYANVGAPMPAGGPVPNAGPTSGGHLTNVVIQLVPSDQRTVTAAAFVDDWRRRAGEVLGAESVGFTTSLGGPNAGAKIDVQLSHSEMENLQAGALALAERLERYDGVADIDPGFSPGKPQMDLTLKPAARAMGITAAELGRQLRASFFGAEAIRQQRGRDEIRVLVRLPETQRIRMQDIEDLVIHAPGGGEITLAEAAFIDLGRSYTEIRRANRRRIVHVTADVVDGAANPTEILRSVQDSDLPALVGAHEGLGWSLEGEQREQMESMAALGRGFLFALLVIFGLLAIPFRSYSQPLIVMAAIPFGLVGAVLGHIVMGFDLSVISVMGIVALSGVVVNDSLVLVDAINKLRAAGQPLEEAVLNGGVRRFRPILLTSLTTFFGLAPMMFETSVQARFLIPMALSLGYGVLFATFVILLFVPVMYLVIEDGRGLLRRTRDPAPRVVEASAGLDEAAVQG